uniref:Uncharacterized protein n=1 Tax=viral metagenome TaxID=1070528 RepID=A0A6M3LZM6_9ZZZZ
MGTTIFTISTTTELLDEIRNKTGNVSNFFNIAARYKLKEYHNRKLTEFMLYIAIPALGFIGSIAATIYFKTLFFYTLMGIGAIYLIIFVFLFYDKYYRNKKEEKKT